MIVSLSVHEYRSALNLLPLFVCIFVSWGRAEWRLTVEQQNFCQPRPHGMSGKSRSRVDVYLPPESNKVPWPAASVCLPDSIRSPIARRTDWDGQSQNEQTRPLQTTDRCSLAPIKLFWWFCIFMWDVDQTDGGDFVRKELKIRLWASGDVQTYKIIFTNEMRCEAFPDLSNRIPAYKGIWCQLCFCSNERWFSQADEMMYL